MADSFLFDISVTVGVALACALIVLVPYIVLAVRSGQLPDISTASY